MKRISATFIVECMKIHRSRMLWLTVLFFSFVPLMMALIFYIQMHPDIAGKLGIIGTKATIVRFGEADWTAYMGLLTQGIAAIGMIGFGFVTTWVFGREYADRTAKEILALPASRTFVVLSKFIVVALWCVLLIAVYYFSGIISGRISNIPGWSNEMNLQNASTLIITSLLTILLCPPVAFFACYGRGYLLPMSFIIITLLIANFTGLLGWGPYFPWAIPGLYGVPAETEGMQLSTVSYIILISTSLTGIVGTWSWWQYADQK